MNLHGVLKKGQGRLRVRRGTAMAVAVGLAMMGGIATAVTASANYDPDDLARLTLVKVVVGGRAEADDWTLIAQGDETRFRGTSPVTHEVEDGTYALSETGPAGYTPSLWDCTNTRTDRTWVRIEADDEHVTCTITNTYNPPEPRLARLTLVKVVVGGRAEADDWTLIAQGDETRFRGTSPVTHEVEDGVYALSETGPAGYTPSLWDCDNTTENGTTVTIGDNTPRSFTNGDNHVAVTCTITNTYNPPEPRLTRLRLVKVVVGGRAEADDWTLIAQGDETRFRGTSPVTHEVEDGVYALSETGPAGYTPSLWDCDNTTENGTTVTIGDNTPRSFTNGDNHVAVTCTITNTYNPQPRLTELRLEKVVVGGTASAAAWTLDAVGTTEGTTTFEGGSTPATDFVAPGVYTLSETGGPTNHSPSLWDCDNTTVNGTTVTIGSNTPSLVTNGDNHVAVTCVITNTFVPPPPPPPPPVIPDVPGISLVKSYTLPGSSDALADAGETIAYSFLVTNTGNVALTSVAVVDLMSGVSAVSCPSTTLAVAATFTCTASYIVTPANVTGADIVNEANASGQPPTGGRVQATAFVSTPTVAPKKAVVAPTVITPAPEVAGVVKNAPVVAGVVKSAPVKSLAFTGAETVPLGLSGLLALVLGAFLTAASRRQSAKRPAAHRARE